jgi:hypothetical protein
LNAPNSFAECRPPLRILHVVTDLKHRPESPGFNPEAHHTMMIAVGWRVGPRLYRCSPVSSYKRAQLR